MTAAKKCALGVCLVGCGSMGRLHGESILRHSKVRSLSLCDAAPSRARELAGELGVEWLPLEEALSSSIFDAFFIATPPAAHVEQLLRVVANGAYVFCEKPLGDDMASIDAAMPELKPFADRIQLGFNRRFDPHIAELKRRVSAEDIGEIEQLRIVSRDFSAPSVESLGNSAGLLFETAIHDFDLTRWLLDDEICELMCMGGALINPRYADAGHIDTATTVMRGARGQQVVIQNSWRTSYGYDQRIEAFGAGGRLSVANPVEPLVFSRECRRPASRPDIVRLVHPLSRGLFHPGYRISGCRRKLRSGQAESHRRLHGFLYRATGHRVPKGGVACFLRSSRQRSQMNAS